MNHLTSEKQSKDQVVNVRQTQRESKEDFLGSVTIKRGHTLFEINLKERTIEPAEFEETPASFIKEALQSKSQGIGVEVMKSGKKRIILDKVPTVHKKLIRKPNCIYISALNRKNVMKKLEQRGIIKIKK